MLAKSKVTWATIAALYLLLVGVAQGQEPWDNSAILNPTEPAIFYHRPVFEGRWVKEGPSIYQFGEFSRSEGWARCQFAFAGRDNWKYFILEIIDGVAMLDQKDYMDNLKYSISFNMSSINFTSITDGSIVFDNFDTSAGKEIEMVRINHLNPTSIKMGVRAGLNIVLIDKTTGLPYIFNSSSASSFEVLVYETESEDQIRSHESQPREVILFGG